MSQEIYPAVLRWLHPEGRFVREKPTLIETWLAVAILQAMGMTYPLEEIVSFLC